MTLQLSVKYGGFGSPVVLLHGLFGAGSNLGALARSLQSEFEVFSLDLPSHGRSGWLEAPSLPGMADCLRQWMDAQDMPGAQFVGHSLGGKVAMQLALRYPERVAALVVADIAPVAYTPHHDTIFAALEAVAAKNCSSREEAASVMAFYLEEPKVIRFLLGSLSRNAQGFYRWRFDLQGISNAYSALLAAPEPHQSFSGPVLFVKGGDSDYIQDQHWPEIQVLFPSASIKIMPGSSHWLHVEKPQLFNGLVSRFLKTHSD